MSYSRNKYRCLLKPNVIVSIDNNIKNQDSCVQNEQRPQFQQFQKNQGPQPRIYPYGPYSYPYAPSSYGYPGYGYPGYGYPGYGYPGSGYPMYPYISKEKEPKEIKEKDLIIETLPE